MNRATSKTNDLIWAPSLDSIDTVNTQCEREESRFILVSPVFRYFFPWWNLAWRSWTLWATNVSRSCQTNLMHEKKWWRFIATEKPWGPGQKHHVRGFREFPRLGFCCSHLRGQRCDLDRSQWMKHSQEIATNINIRPIQPQPTKKWQYQTQHQVNPHEF